MLDVILEFLKLLLIYGSAFAFVVTLISYGWNPQRTFEFISSRWHTTLDSMHLSSEEVYAAMTESLKTRRIAAQIKTVSYSQFSIHSGIFQPNQKCLRIEFGDQLLLLCAAPVGSCYYVSWWLGEPLSIFKDFLRRIPFVSGFFRRMFEYHTFHEMDEAQVFCDTVHGCLLTILDEMLEAKNIKPLSGASRQIAILPLQKVG